MFFFFCIIGEDHNPTEDKQENADADVHNECKDKRKAQLLSHFLFHIISDIFMLYFLQC